MPSFAITPLTDHTGAEVIGLDFTQPIDIETRVALNRACRAPAPWKIDEAAWPLLEAAIKEDGPAQFSRGRWCSFRSIRTVPRSMLGLSKNRSPPSPRRLG